MVACRASCSREITPGISEPWVSTAKAGFSQLKAISGSRTVSSSLSSGSSMRLMTNAAPYVSRQRCMSCSPSSMAMASLLGKNW